MKQIKNYVVGFLFLSLGIAFQSCVSDDDTTKNSNTKVENKEETAFSIETLSSGFTHSLYIDKSGKLYGWGNSGSGELCEISSNVSPKIIDNSDWKQISAGYNSSLGIKKDGTLWGVGLNNSGQLGIGTSEDVSTFHQIGTDSNWIQVSLGYRHALALKKDGTLWAWGSNQFLQLGKSDDAPSLEPIKVGNDNDWVQVFAGHNSSFALKKDGTLWAWGYNYAGQLGIGSTSNVSTPTKVKSDIKWRYVSVGISFTAGIKEDGTLWTWGRNYFGELGNGKGNKSNDNNSSVPVKVESDKKWKKVTLGKGHALAIKEDGTLWIWGNNTFGKLGIGEKPNYNYFVNVPQQIGKDTDWIDISSGEGFNIALKKDGSLWGWGSNRYNEIGGENYYEISPRKIVNIQ